MAKDPSKKPRESRPITDGGADEPRHGAPFPIAGIGASAGGLEALTELLHHLPPDTGMAFVLVQHLDPERESSLTSLLAKTTSMPVREITKSMKVEPNCVYVIPPNKRLGIEGGVLKLHPRPQARVPFRSIDFFLESLARDSRESAIGVILSGTATDGTLGMEAIKAEAGITFAQDESARYDSMPRSAAAAGCVDFVLPPAKIADELAAIAKHPHVAGRADAAAQENGETPLAARGRPRKPPSKGRKGKGEGEGHEAVLTLLRNHSGVDFSLYKSATIQRRITRRMALNKKTSIEHYARFLRGNAKELDALYSDVLIGVTSFFRNPEAFEVLKRKVFPKILPERHGDPLRVWVLGCSTGQEAYSLAIAHAEFSEKAARLPKLQVFATDLNEALLERARAGLYSKNMAADVSPERLRRFFVEEDGGYRVIKALRDSIVFARQNFLSDPPFSRMDLISCRNLLIYINPDTQRQAMPTFHYALRPKGCLFLGASESVGPFTDLFETVDKKHRFYSKKPGPAPQVRLTTAYRAGKEDAPLQPAASPGFHAEGNAQREADRITRNRYAPPSVLVNAELQILEFRGDTAYYLKPPTGHASFNLLKMAREGLMLPLRAALNKAKKENKAVRREGVPVDRNGGRRKASFEVVPLKNVKERCYLVFFEDTEPADSAAAAAPEPRAGKLPLTAKQEPRRVQELEAELAETRDFLQSVQEQSEAAQEELQASSEEVTSANEELQSLNEELETSKEELESSNEELTTVNEEMANRNAELGRLNADLENLQTSTRLSIVLLGRDLAVRRFSRQAEKQLNLLASDVGRPIGHIRHDLVFVGPAPEDASSDTVRTDNGKVDRQKKGRRAPKPADDAPTDLESFVAGVIADVREREHEVRDKEGRWHSLRVRPYFTLDNKVDGAVLVLVDISELKTTQREIRFARDFADSAIDTVREPLLVLDGELRVERANRAFYGAFRVSSADTVGKSVFDLGGRQWDIPRLRGLLEVILPQGSFFDDCEVTADFGAIGRRTMLLNARAIQGRTRSILLGIQDVTELLHVQAASRRSELRYRRLFEAAKDAILIMDPETRKIVDANPYMTELIGYTREELLGKELFEIGLLEDQAAARAAFRKIKKDGVIRYKDLPLATKAGGRREVEVVANLYRENGDEIIQCNIRDITERKRAEEINARLAAIVGSSDDAIVGKDIDGVITNWNPGAERLFGYTAEEVVGGPISVIVPPERLEEETGILESIRRKEGVERFETVRRRKDGTLVDVSLTISPILDGQGRVTGASKIARDIGESRRNRMLLEDSENQFRSLVEQVKNYAIFRADVNGLATTWNEGVRGVLGFTSKEFIGIDIATRIFTPEDAAAGVPQRELEEAAAAGQASEDRWMMRKDGTRFFAAGITTALHGEDGKLAGFSKIMRDQTDRKLLEEKLFQTTAELMEADRRKNEFLALLAHELRNPLAPLRNALHILRLTENDGKGTRASVEMMERQVGQMVRLVDDLLDVSRISQGKIELRLGRIDLLSSVNHALEAARTGAVCMEQELAVTLPTEPLYLDADPARLSQVVGNLLDNACKFTGKGGRISLTVERESAQAVIRVRDNGIGIALDQLARIFEMFTQIDSSLERMASGLGIGLTLVKSIVEMHGGTLEAHSAGLGHGAEFVVRLPLKAGAPSPPELAAGAAATAASRRVLVVDDNRDAAETLATLLDLDCHETRVAHDGPEALKEAAAFRPAVIFLDIGLPGMSGYEVARQIREAPWGKSMALVALTGLGQPGDLRRSQEAGFNAHKVKPVDHAALIALLADLPDS